MTAQSDLAARAAARVRRERVVRKAAELMVATANSVEGLSGSLAEAYAAGGATAIEEALRAHAAATKQRFRAEFAQLLDELEAKTEIGERP